MTGIFVLMCGQRATTLEGGIEEGSLDFSVCSPCHRPLLLGLIPEMRVPCDIRFGEIGRRENNADFNSNPRKRGWRSRWCESVSSFPVRFPYLVPGLFNLEIHQAGILHQNGAMGKGGVELKQAITVRFSRRTAAAARAIASRHCAWTRRGAVPRGVGWLVGACRIVSRSVQPHS